MAVEADASQVGAAVSSEISIESYASKALRCGGYAVGVFKISKKNRAHKNVTRDRYVGRLTGDIDIIVVVVMVEEEGPRER